MSFNISNDSEFLNEPQDSNLDGISTNEELSKINFPNEEIKTSENNEQLQKIPSIDNVNKKSKQHHKHRSSAQSSSKKRPILDLSEFDFGAIDEHDNRSSIQRSIQEFPSEINDINSRASIIEERITNYLDISLSSLKSDVLNEIEFLFNRKRSIQSIIDSFILNTTSEIKKEIHFLRCFSLADQPMNISIEIDIPKPRPIIACQPLSTNEFMNQISNLKAQYSQKLYNIGKNISNVIKNRDKEISRMLDGNKKISSTLRQLQNKTDSLQNKFNELDFKSQLITHQSNFLNEKIKEFESDSFYNEMKKKELEEIKNYIDDIYGNFVDNKQNSENQVFLQNINNLSFEVKDLSNIIDNTSKNASYFADSYKKMDFQLKIVNLQNQRGNFLRYSAPTYSNISKQPLVFSSAPKTQNIQNIPLNNKASYYSPVYIRKTPHYEFESDDEDETSDVSNFLLDNQFSPPLSNYT